MKAKMRLAALLAALALLAGCFDQAEEAPQQAPNREQSEAEDAEYGKWDIISAESGLAPCRVEVTKNYGGQQTGINARVTVPVSPDGDRSAVPLTLTLPEGAYVSIEESRGVSGEGTELTVDFTAEDPCLTLRNDGYSRTYKLLMEETEGAG